MGTYRDFGPFLERGDSLVRSPFRVKMQKARVEHKWSGLTQTSDLTADMLNRQQRAISGREQCDPGQSILVAPIAGRYDEAGDRDRVAIAGARWDL
jgi:hypothetical protein